MQLLTDYAGKGADLQKFVSAKEVEFASTRSGLDAKEATLHAKVLEFDQLNYDWGSARADVGRGERVIRDFAELVCTGYNLSMRVQPGDYPDRPNAMLTKARLRGEYLGGYRVRAGDDRHSLHLKDADSVEERRDGTPLPEADGEVVVVPPSPPSS